MRPCSVSAIRMISSTNQIIRINIPPILIIILSMLSLSISFFIFIFILRLNNKGKRGHSCLTLLHISTLANLLIVISAF